MQSDSESTCNQNERIRVFKFKNGGKTMKIEKVNDFKKIQVLLKEKDVVALKAFVNYMDVHHLTDLMEVLKPEQQAVTFRLLSKDRALYVFEKLNVYTQQVLLKSLSHENAIEVFTGLEPDDRIPLMEELPAGIAKRLLEALPEKEREMTSLLLGYASGTAGHRMTPKYVRLSKSMTARDAIEKVRACGKNLETVNILYVTDDSRKLHGMVTLAELIIAHPEEKIEAIMTKESHYVNTSTEVKHVVELLKELDLIALPVVDAEKRLVGVITVDDAMDILEEEAIDAAFDKVGFIELNKQENDRSRILISGSVVEVWKVRIPFLIITLIGGMLAGGLIAYFEESLEAIVAVAFFVPVVMDMGGNVGTQSSTIFTRALVLGQINFKRFLQHWFREIVIGMSMGVILGIGGGVFAYVWQGNASLGLVVGVALAITITIATGLGFMVPYVLVKLGFDQAAGSDPIITTLKDISGLGIYFFLVNMFLL